MQRIAMMRNKNDSRLTMFIGIFIFTFLASFAHGIPDFSDLPPGPYCGDKYPHLNCCNGRRDECSAPIRTTTCYCDEFCDRTNSTDCCPDFWSHCRGIGPGPEGPPNILSCVHNNIYYAVGDMVKENCNKCKCTSMGPNNAEMLCETNRCLVETEILENVDRDSSRLGWRAENHTEFWGRTLAEGIEFRLGTLNPSRSVVNVNPVRRMYNPGDLPISFDSRTHWRNLINGVRDQGWCGASWALSAVDVASDRYAIMSRGREAVELSAQHLLSCNSRGQQGCQGGYLDRAWMYMKRYGLVDEACYPWAGNNKKCTLRKRTNLREANCRIRTVPPYNELYKVGPSYLLGNETDIMKEIMTSGPVQATMKVYQDFFVYKSGVYQHSSLVEGERTGYHSVRIIGWGEERSIYGPPVKYWVIANSWGSDWGENGFFRILRGVNECGIEKYVLAAWAQTKMAQPWNLNGV